MLGGARDLGCIGCLWWIVGASGSGRRLVGVRSVSLLCWERWSCDCAMVGRLVFRVWSRLGWSRLGWTAGVSLVVVDGSLPVGLLSGGARVSQGVFFL